MISVNTKLIEDNLLNEMAHLINKNIKLNGSWFFQVKKDINNEYCLLEIATRFGGSSAIQRFKGINFPLMNLFNEEGKNVEIINHSFEIEIDRGLDIKGNIKLNFDKVYVDLDDTIIINDKVNTEIVSKLYDFLNEGKKLYLISKHKHNIYKTLKKYKINKKMFKKIIHLKPTDKKYKYMKKNSIFIDDSFSERKEVFDNLNIPTFSINNLNIL